MSDGDESPGLGLFQGYGVEIEYMIVDQDTLAVRPISDVLLRDAAGNVAPEIEMGALAWSNELVAHVIELKTNGPAAELGPLPGAFAADVREINCRLAASGARLMPSAMHPLMDPLQETRLWPHDHSDFYRAFDRIFDCRGHGWSNLQSVHINLPFSGDDEFGRLHAAIRLVLPILPALAASSPFVEGRLSGHADSRLEYYRHNCDRIPSLTAHVVPEPVFTRQGYQERILDRIAKDLLAHDPEGVLEPEWTNARGAIARFGRDSIEIRLLDVQECPAADLAVVAVVTALVRGLCEERWCASRVQRGFDERRLEGLLLRCIDAGGAASLEDTEFLKVLGCDKPNLTASQLWAELTARLLRDGLLPDDALWTEPLACITNETLAQRITRAAGAQPSPERIIELYRELCECLESGRLFQP